MYKRVVNVFGIDKFLREPSNKSEEESKKDSDSGFTSIMVNECKRYTDDQDKINKIIGG